LFLVDGTALAYRSHFAFIRNPLTTSKGQNVSAVYGFINSLLRMLDQENPDFCGVAFDTPEPTFRHKKFKDYKATRDKTPDELIEQFPMIKTVTRNLGLSLLEIAGWEADDVIGTMAVEGADQGMEVFLVTGDKDFMQLVSDRIKIYNIFKSDEDSILQGIPEVEDKFGVPPEKVIEVMGLMGDSSDNIPGVRGVGEKTAIKLIKEFGTIAALYENLDRISAKGTRNKLETSRDDAFLSRELVTIDTKVPLEITMQALEIAPRNQDGLRDNLLELEFNQLLKRLSEGAADEEEAPRNYILVDDEDKYAKYKKRLDGARFMVIDTETTSIHPLEADIVGISVSFAEGEGYYLPANLQQPLFVNKDGDLAVFLEDLKAPLSDPEVKICGQNIKYDLMVFHRAGLKEIRGVEFDTMVAHYLLSPGEMRHNLDYLTLKYLNIKKIPTSDLIGKGKSQISMADVPVDRVCEYACEDVDMTHRLKTVFEPKLKEERLDELFRDVEMPLVRVLEDMERTGVRIDPAMLEEMSGNMGKRLETLAEEIYEMAGLRFNINSTQQLGKVLFERLELHKELGIKKVKKTKTGYATNAATLESMASHPLPRTVIEYRQLKKLQSTYLDTLPRLINERTGRIHASFNQTVTATGRLSSSDPNLQNIPIRTEMGRQIRKAFVPGDDDSVLLSADYSQIELRIMAHVSEDEALLKAFQEGEDIHRGTAALIFDVAPEAVTSEMRGRAKTINFGIIYGMGPHRLSRELGISFPEAQQFIASYFDVFSGVKGYLDRTLEEAREKGYVSTLLGRKRQIDEIDSANSQIRSMAENIAVNTPIQGTAADLIKKAMIDLHRALQERKMKSAMIIQVHDELLFDVPNEELEEMRHLVKEKMEGALDLRIPVLVEMGFGRNWLEAH
jgi:DNA polymerase-1